MAPAPESCAGARAASFTTAASTPTLRAVDDVDLDDDDDEMPDDRVAVWLTIAIVVPIIVMWLWVTSLP